VLEERAVMRVGALAPRPVDLRFVAATNRDLAAEVARGTFRQDLYYRLNGISIVVPPLRERRGEIEPLAERFVALAAAQAGVAPPSLSREARDALMRYAWPGNVRELRNAIERAVLLAGPAVLSTEHLAPEILGAPAAAAPSIAAPAAPTAGVDRAGGPRALRSELDALERQRIVEALEECSGNQTRAARLLGISRHALLARLEAYGIPRPRKGAPGDD
jgi:DNA-binding NtrC family response regulator